MSLWGLVFATMYEPLIGIFINEGTPEATRLEITRLGRWMLCAAFWQTLDAVGIVLSGALRGLEIPLGPGGDGGASVVHFDGLWVPLRG